MQNRFNLLRNRAVLRKVSSVNLFKHRSMTWEGGGGKNKNASERDITYTNT